MPNGFHPLKVKGPQPVFKTPKFLCRKYTGGWRQPFQHFSSLRGLRGHPFKVLQGASHRRRRGSAFSVWVVKYWNKLAASVVTAPSVNVFKKRLEKVWTEVFPHLTHRLSTHLPISLSPIPPSHHPLTVTMSICYSTPCSIYVVSPGPLWPTVYHYKS